MTFFQFLVGLKHLLPHFDIAILVGLVIFMTYNPPKSSGEFFKFINMHFGDSIGFYILHLGIALILISGIYPQVNGVHETGSSLILAAMGVLKLTGTKPPDTVVTNTTTTTGPVPNGMVQIPPARTQ